MYTYSFAISAILSLLIFPALVFAQTQSNVPSSAQGGVPFVEGADSTGPIDCFDHYTFGSIQADIQTNLGETTPGSTISFTGDIVNDNPYPIVDGKLYVKIFKEVEGAVTAGDGNDVVDQFVIADNINIGMKGSVPVSYSWYVPENISPGSYYAAYFFVTSDSYNLMGLSFTDDVVGNTAPFIILPGEATATAATLSKADTTLNGRDHHFAAAALHFNAEETVTVKTTVTNPSAETKTIPIEWTQYSWDAMKPENKVSQQVIAVTLAPGETKEVSYEVRYQRGPIVYVTAVLQDGKAKSILNIRYVRDGIPETRINFPGISSFPIEKGEGTTLFTCAHSTNEPVVTDNTVTLRLTDRDNNLIHEYIYVGDISGAMSGFGQVFTPKKDYSYAKLTATIERSGVLIEEVTVEYDCAKIPGLTCKDAPGKYSPAGLFDSIQKIIFAIILGILAIFVLAFLVLNRRKTSATTIKSLLFALILIPLFQAVPVEAKSVTWTSSALPKMAYCNTKLDKERCETSPAGSSNYVNMALLPGARANVTYLATVTNSATGAVISDNDTVLVGTKIRVSSTPHATEHVQWFGTGYNNDTPYGDWIQAAANPSYGCLDKDYVGSIRFEDEASYQYIHTYIPLVVDPPDGKTTTVPSSKLKCDAAKVDGNGTLTQDCTVIAPGKIDIKVNVPETFGHFYYRSDLYRFENKPGYNAFGIRRGCKVSEAPLREGGHYAEELYSDRFVTSQDGRFRSYSGGMYNPYANQSSNSSASTCEYAGTPYEAFYCGGYAPKKAMYDVSGENYRLEIPAKSIPFTFNAEGVGNQPPAPPVITGPPTTPAESNTSHTVVANDPDKDQIRYGVSNQQCTQVTAWLPSTGYVNSGASQVYEKYWTTPGTYTFYILAEDKNGARSTCTSYTITVTKPLTSTIDLKVNNSDNPPAVNLGDTITVSWTTSNLSNCVLAGSGLTAGPVPENGTKTTIAETPGNNSYVLNCGSKSDAVTLVVNDSNQPPNPPAINGPETIYVGQTTNYTIRAIDPDGNRIYYNVSEKDGPKKYTATPAVGYVNSGDTITAKRGDTWTTPGTYIIRAQAVDEYGAQSGWTEKIITVIEMEEPVVTPTDAPAVSLIVNEKGKGGDKYISKGGTATVTWNPNGFVGTCTLKPEESFKSENASAESNKQSFKDLTINATTTFTYTCSGTYNGEVVTKEAVDTIFVTEDGKEPSIPSFTGPEIIFKTDTPIVESGEPVTIVWSKNGFEGTCNLRPDGRFAGENANADVETSKSLTFNAYTVLVYKCDGGANGIQEKRLIIEVLGAEYEV